MRLQKHMAPFLEALRESGMPYSVEKSRRGHYKLYVRGVLAAVVPSTPSCHRGQKNGLADLRRKVSAIKQKETNT